mmetsp:Transcript_19022/g.38561  ORF Transcript_19022/g.38561 Transcript_19022/m.38561 type:complete len:303 (-) Transcript_19022:177-1085(-)|eukprot:CAMPEP_0183303584 /NCGR_PEP_ID=MMETSP0160_2-20130417/8965_1 /TAXON_ID=2839 ORGANISM="Odontella Sinensis, Strain Grunow 1884" /NCGR_SAMPLE_ID=MMETSP0160_2 /ASSEMBLY_ACC=CAM_ASM_000250 /LENGTH=302 /DNA_ID=CAMNT_0025466507 /DNA_START=49 /DNA_END=957 /DNA_ORIENTATION=+
MATAAPPIRQYIPPILQSSSQGHAARNESIAYADAQIVQILHQVGFNDEERRKREEEERKRTEEEKNRHYWLTVGHAIFASVSMVSSLICIRLASWGITKLAFSIPLGAAPYAVQQRRQLNKRETVRTKLNKLRGEVNHLLEENIKLRGVNETLGKEVTKLKAMEEDLNSILVKQGGDLNEFCALVKENSRIQLEMKKHLEAKAKLDVTSAVIKSSNRSSGSFQYGDEEIDRLVARLRTHEDMAHCDADDLRHSLRNSGSRSISSIVNTSRSIRNNSVLGKTRTTSPIPESCGVNIWGVLKF